MHDHVIIVAAGAGSRMHNALPKQFLPLAGKLVLQYSIEKFHRYNPQINIVVVVHPEYIDFWKSQYNEIPHEVLEGGTTRFESVRNGLACISDETGIVGIHDAARPLVSLKTIESCYHTARAHGTAIPVIEHADSLRKLEGNASVHVDRSVYRMVQTPQCFEISLLRRAYTQPGSEAFTDDASVVEAMGETLCLVPGNRENFKLTVPEDLRLAEALLLAYQ
ncbi:MAG: 2-C-methyl-D-erythritol 4-phosphate cytidylyltransferase [Flavobacteriales bacterium]|nr:2-C-methyl-D-erythritol 4-phosphate cytidylyltransferase [Flavobacteriales bacterium]